MSREKKQKQRRFTTEAQIIHQINNGQKRLADLNREADEWEQKSKASFRAGELMTGRFAAEEAEHIRKRRVCRQETRLKKLKMALSEFQTALLPGMGDDPGVVLRRLHEA